MNFKELIIDVLQEKGKTIQDLVEDKVVVKNAIYEYEEFTPSLRNILNIANYLQVSLDYIVGKSSENNFKKYKMEQNNFYNKFDSLLKEMQITKYKLRKDLHISNADFHRWKNGTTPMFSTILQIVEYLNCSIDDLLEFEE